MVCRVSGFESCETLPAETLAKRFAVVPVPWAVCRRWRLRRSAAQPAILARLDLSATLHRYAITHGQLATLAPRCTVTRHAAAPSRIRGVRPMMQHRRCCLYRNACTITQRLRRALHDATPTGLLLSRNASYHARALRMQTPKGFAIILRVGTVGAREIHCGGREPKIWLVFLIFLWISFTFAPLEAHIFYPHTRTRVLLKQSKIIYSCSGSDNNRITGEIRFILHFTHIVFSWVIFIF